MTSEHETVAAEAPAGARPDAPPDLEVVRRVLGGETALFEVLVRRHDRKVYRAVRGVLRDEAECEDAMQQAWLLAYANLRGFDGAAAFSTWLVRIALNEALGRLRRRARLAVVAEVPDRSEDAVTPPRESPEDRAATAEAVRLLEGAIDRLPLRHRTVLLLRDVEQLSTEDAARALGVSADAVKVRLHRARRALRERVDEDLGRAAGEAFPFLAPRCDRIVAAVMRGIARGRG